MTFLRSLRNILLILLLVTLIYNPATLDIVISLLRGTHYLLNIVYKSSKHYLDQNFPRVAAHIPESLDDIRQMVSALYETVKESVKPSVETIKEGVKPYMPQAKPATCDGIPCKVLLG